MEHSFETMLDVPQRGRREYLQGGDILRAVFDVLSDHVAVGDITAVRLKFSSLAHSALALSVGPTGPAGDAKKANGTLYVDLNDGTSLTGFLTETGAKVARRIEGSEAAIREKLEIDGQVGLVAPVKGADLIEHVVFVTKHLHNAVIPLSSGRWAVVDFALDRYLPRDPWGAVRVEIESQAGGRITASRVTVGSDPIGLVRFMALA